jgi:hypothetical protein
MSVTSMKYKHEVSPEQRPTPQLSIVADDVPAKTAPKAELYELKPSCFRTDKRFHCSEQCPWARSCKKLVAVWLR